MESTEAEIQTILYSALGERVREYLNDPLVTEIRINSDQALWINRLGEGRSHTGVYIDPENTERAIFTVAATVNEVCDTSNRAISAELPGSGARFQGVLPPITQKPVIVIRKKAVRVFSLSDFVSQGVITAELQSLLREAVESRKNILVVGGTDSGKTTFANALLDTIRNTNDRVVIIEDIAELQCSAKDVEYLRSKEGLVSLRDLVRITMRLSPDRIVIGEVRGAEALDLIKAWNTGHSGGISTVHANSAEQGLSRLENLAQESGFVLSKQTIAEAIHLIIYLEKVGQKRVVKEIVQVLGLKKHEYEFSHIYKRQEEQ